MITQPEFSVITGAQVSAVLRGQEEAVVELVRRTYLEHEAGRTVNPPSYFLTFPEAPRNRIIALPAALTGPDGTSGLKWISSFPANIERELPRASAVTILNDAETGYPQACLESSIISAARTAASAVLGAAALSANRPRPTRLGLVGAGVINRYIHRYLQATGWQFDEVRVHDLAPERAADFCALLADRGERDPQVAGDAEDLIRTSDLVVFATVAPTPHVTDPAWFDHHPLVLHISLRDLGPEVIRSGQNIVDDVDHVLKAQTSVHLVEQADGDRDFIDGTLAQVLTGAVTPAADRTIVFSPFGLGVLDLALARFIHTASRATGAQHDIPDFFHDLNRLDRA
ncbi:2,3-diaminopropionate biosynthesis protein SbnB [Granulicoccus sp. GXG6511]|uniref:2,3-diaminopropionate biosynthesis protein SbnB n=1 Tax=Granulicoccus sp. GXG6511 TaxID=3381351 RepID=UPI003D7D90E4